MRRLVVFVAVVSSMFSSSPALAQDDAPAEPDAASSFREAEARYLAGDVEGALQSMQRSYELSGRAELLYNLGELRRELGKCREARRDYQAYLERVTSGVRRERALAAVAELRAECPEADTALVEPSPAAPPLAPPPVEQSGSNVSDTPPPAPAAPPPVESTSVHPLTVAGWSAIGAGVLAGAFATYFAVDAANQERRLEQRVSSLRANPDNGPFTSADKELEEDGERSAMWARVLGIGAAGLAAVGVSVLVFGPETHEKSQAGVSIEWRGDGATAAYACSF